MGYQRYFKMLQTFELNFVVDLFHFISEWLNTSGLKNLDYVDDKRSVLERELEDQDSEELTPLINSKSMTQHKISKKSILKSSNYNDPNISKSNGCEYSKLEVVCE